LLAIGADIGSSAVKACCFELDGEPYQVLDQRSVNCALKTSHDNWAEHDLAGMEAALRQVLEVAPQGTEVGLASAMHGLVLLDAAGRAIGDAISWADGRSSAQAQRLEQLEPGAYARTGTPLHPMAWPAKLAWVRDERPEWWRRLARVTDLKSFLWERLTGEVAPLDPSSASSTGLWNSLTGAWDGPLRQRLEMDRVALPQVVSGHRASWQGRTLHLGGGDGPLGNLGVGAVGGGRVAVTVGTSGAVRRHLPERKPVSPGLFLYGLEGMGWIEGGAISNGGAVLDWLRLQSSYSHKEILQQAGLAAPGARGMEVYPYFLGERAPFWQAGVRSRIVGWTPEHGFADLARATLEGVAYCLRRLLDLMGSDPEEPLRCSGGLFASEFWRSLFADVTGRPLSWGPSSHASALGAALLTRPDAFERSLALPLEQVFRPDPQACRRYDELYQAWNAGEATTC
jgi:gluconokinase